MSKPTGGPAFPSRIENNSSEKTITGFNNEELAPKTFSAYPGLSLRDYFAAAALQGMSCNALFSHASVEELAEAAYRRADAMLQEHAK